MNNLKPVISHSWNISEEEAYKLQIRLSSKVICEDQLGDVSFVAGVDVAYEKNSEKLVAAVAVLDSNSHQVVDSSVAIDSAQFPYVPGLFSFRELPPLIQALASIKQIPDLIVCDGQGIAHPRRFGLASHLGVLFDIPTIGCGKTRLIGESVEPGLIRGSHKPLIDKNEIVGSVLRTQSNVKPVYVSIGHRVSLDTARNWILKLTPQYRLPETTRYADQIVKRILKSLT